MTSKFKLAIVFTQPPFGSSSSREGLDELLAASAFCDEDELAIFFIYDGVFNLINHQQPEKILQKDHIVTFKLIELYDLKHCFVCQQSLQSRQLDMNNILLPSIQCLPSQKLFKILSHSKKVLTF